MEIGKWNVTEDIDFSRRLEKAKSAELTPLGLRTDIGFAVFSGSHGVYNTTLEQCDCYDFDGKRPCKHILRLALEMGIIDGEYLSDKRSVLFPQEISYIEKKVFVDPKTGQVFDDRPYPEGPLSGMTVVITGEFDGQSRENLTIAINGAGGKVSGSVSRRTDLLVVGRNPGSKLERAHQYGIKTVSIEEILSMIGEKK